MWAMIGIFAIGVVGWVLLGFINTLTTPKTLYGTCDGIGCRNEATVHYGLEEWYCDACDRMYNGRS